MIYVDSYYWKYFVSIAMQKVFKEVKLDVLVELFKTAIVRNPTLHTYD